MPTSPKSLKRPRDPNQLAAFIVGVASGEVSDTPPDDGKDPNAKALGSKGGKARASSMSPERRAEIAKAAAAKRWGKDAD